MEIFSKTSKNIIRLIKDFQNSKINKNDFNKEIFVNTIFNNFYFSKRGKKDIKIKENQNKAYQSFFKLEYKTEQKEKQLFANIRDRKAKKMVEESIKASRDHLIKELSAKEDMLLFVEQSYNTYIPPKNTSLSMHFQYNTNHNYNKKLIPDSSLQIKYLNTKQRIKEDNLITLEFIEPPFFPDFNFDSEENENSNQKEIDNNDNNNENKEKNNIEENNKVNEEENENKDDIPMNKIELEDEINSLKNDNEELIDLIGEDDEILFYEEKLKPDENPKKVNEWNDKISGNDMISDFQYLKQRKKIVNEQVNELYYNLQQDKIISKEITNYLKTSQKNYEEISQKDHYHEFKKFLNEKIYRTYIKKMNYNYVVLMLLLFFDFEGLVTSYYDIVDPNQTMLIFVKRIILFVGISNSKVYDPIIHAIENKKGQYSFEEFLNCFMPIFDLPEKYQYYKYGFLLFLVKKKDENIITLSNFNIFCNLIRGKLIYEEDICEDIIGKLIPIIKTKYPKDDSDNLNYNHVTIILEFLVNYMYGG